jgi:hypothetical protein
MVVTERDIFSDDPVARYYEEVVKLVRISPQESLSYQNH